MKEGSKPFDPNAHAPPHKELLYIIAPMTYASHPTTLTPSSAFLSILEQSLYPLTKPHLGAKFQLETYEWKGTKFCIAMVPLIDMPEIIALTSKMKVFSLVPTSPSIIVEGYCVVDNVTTKANVKITFPLQGRNVFTLSCK